MTEYPYRGEGWGLTHDEHSLIMSDGTSELRFLDPATFAEQRTVRVFDGTTPVERSHRTAHNTLDVRNRKVNSSGISRR